MNFQDKSRLKDCSDGFRCGAEEDEDWGVEESAEPTYSTLSDRFLQSH